MPLGKKVCVLANVGATIGGNVATVVALRENVRSPGSNSHLTVFGKALVGAWCGAVALVLSPVLVPASLLVAVVTVPAHVYVHQTKSIQ